MGLKQDATRYGNDEAGDFRSDKGVLIFSTLAVPAGKISTLVAKVLVRLIALVMSRACLHP
jgi:hypothetical protein